MLSIVARAFQSFKNGAREWRWQTQAQLTRRVFVETSMSWEGSDTGRHGDAISERKVSWHVCVSGSSVGQSAGFVVCNCMVPGSALGGILAFLLLCAGLPTKVSSFTCLPLYFLIIIIIIIIIIIQSERSRAVGEYGKNSQHTPTRNRTWTSS